MHLLYFILVVLLWGVNFILMKRAGLQAAESAASRHFSTPAREFAFVARKLTGVFTFIAVLNAEFNGAPRLKAHQGLQRVLTPAD